MQTSNSLSRRTGYLAYSLACYTLFLATFLYAVGFVGNFWRSFGWNARVFRSMDVGGAAASMAAALLIDTLLLGVFALQHSGMARSGFKRWWTRVIPAPIERSTYVLAASLCLALLFWQWRPLGTSLLWDLSGTTWEAVLIGLSLLGWLTVLAATFMINHFELFGLQQAWHAFRGTKSEDPKFSTPAFYKAVRHPIYLGFIVAFWATPFMTLGHLLFAAATTGYILLAIPLEERDLVQRYGDLYLDYRRRVSMLLPFGKRKHAPPRAHSESVRDRAI